MSSNTCGSLSPFPALTDPLAPLRPQPSRRWALLVAVALGVAALHGYALALLTGLEIVLLVEPECPPEFDLVSDELGLSGDVTLNYKIELLEAPTEPKWPDGDADSPATARTGAIRDDPE